DACVPDCAGAQCGDNGCGNMCGTCSPSQTCADRRCVVTDCPASCTDDCPQGCFRPGDCTAPGDGLDVHANIETIGIVGAPHPARPVVVYYRPPGNATWFKGHDLTDLPD